MKRRDAIPLPRADRWLAVSDEFRTENLDEITTVKETDTRKIFRTGRFHIKAFRLNPVRAIMDDPAKKEYRIALLLHKKHLTAPPAAYCHHNGWSYFAAYTVKGHDAAELIQQKWHVLDRITKKALISLFARFITEIAESGVFQPDFHLNNILFDTLEKRFLLIDLHRASVKKNGLTEKEFLTQLSFILPPFMDAISYRHIMECASALAMKWPALKDSETRFRTVEAAFDNMKRYWRKRGWRKTERMFRVTRRNRSIELHSDRLPYPLPDTVRDFMNDPKAYVSMTECTIIKDSRHTLCISMKPAETGEQYFIKAYRSSGHIKSFSYIARKSRTVKAWENSWQLLMRNIPTPKPVYAVCSGNPWLPVYGAVAYPWTDDAGHASLLANNLLSEQVRGRLFIIKLAYFLWNMHERGIFHGDCKISNLIIKRNMSFMISDLDSMKTYIKINDQKRIRDISAMCLSLEKTAREPGFDLREYMIRSYALYHVPWRSRITELYRAVTIVSRHKLEKQNRRKRKTIRTISK